MTTTILLIRHAAHGHLGRVLTGRMDGVELTIEGQEQAERLARCLEGEPLTEVHSSGALRARQTAAALANPQGLPVHEADRLAEIDFGAWTGRTFAELEADPSWHQWNTQRSIASPPGGEAMRVVQDRAWRHVVDTARRIGDATAAMVSHCDVIRAVICKVLGLPLADLLRFDIGPASVSRVALGSWGEKIISINEYAA